MKKSKLTIFCAILMVFGISIIGTYIYTAITYECDEYVCSEKSDAWLIPLGIILFIVGSFMLFFTKYSKHVKSKQNKNDSYYNNDKNISYTYTDNSKEEKTIEKFEELDGNVKEDVQKIIELSTKFSGQELAEEIKKMSSSSGGKTTITFSRNVKVGSGDIKEELDEAKALYENGDITKEEYEAMRKDILNID